jgi:hypothetical protein
MRQRESIPLTHYYGRDAVAGGIAPCGDEVSCHDVDVRISIKQGSFERKRTTSGIALQQTA